VVPFKAEVSGPGFINIYVSKALILDELKMLVIEGIRAPFVGPKKRVVIDFSSPNIAKEMHVGHLRLVPLHFGSRALKNAKGKTN
jgi:arginyl-tRNA synthetase